jgi:hypothetical protein
VIGFASETLLNNSIESDYVENSFGAMSPILIRTISMIRYHYVWPFGLTICQRHHGSVGERVPCIWYESFKVRGFSCVDDVGSV